jgi:hypothetical protein
MAEFPATTTDQLSYVQSLRSWFCNTPPISARVSLKTDLAQEVNLSVRNQRTAASSPALQCWESISKLSQSAKRTTERRTIIEFFNYFDSAVRFTD